MAVMKSKWFWAVVLMASAGSVYAYLNRDQSDPADTRFTGAYRFDDGRLASVTPVDDQRFRLRFYQDGQVRQIFLGDGNQFQSSSGFSVSAVRDVDGEFVVGPDGGFDGLTLANGARADRLALKEEIVHFSSGELRMRAKLVLPQGDGPHPVAIMVHGSEAYSAVDFYFMPYLLAANGIAAMAYDKRGTGGSQGEYTQDFFALSGDTAAAAQWVKGRADIDPDRINLMGFSQGGWIAPLAAKQIEGLRAISIHYGVAVPVTREDRWGYVYQLRRKGFGEDEIRQADEINRVIEQIVDHGNDDAWEKLGELVEARKDSDWFKAISGSDSILGKMAETSVPMSLMRAYFWFKSGSVTSSRTWEPEPTLRSLDVPQHWILAGEDSSAPTEETVEVLERLRAEGLPIDLLVYPNAEHGIIDFEEDEQGNRTYLGYSETYLRSSVEWLKKRNGVL